MGVIGQINVALALALALYAGAGVSIMLSSIAHQLVDFVTAEAIEDACKPFLVTCVVQGSHTL